MAQKKVVHIVRRFGRQGGMESYVWHLVKALAGFGVWQKVICEEILEPNVGQIECIRVPKSSPRPRWKAMMGFRANVSSIAQRLRQEGWIIHSHERTVGHHVTTIHGPSIHQRNQSILDMLNPRLIAWEKMEREEVCSKPAPTVVFVSNLLRNIYLEHHRMLDSTNTVVGWPGVSSGGSQYIGNLTSERDYKKLLFVGQEFKRKGLSRAKDIVALARSIGYRLELDVYGTPDLSGVPEFRGFDWINFKGWEKDLRWKEYDALLHPASIEPFGMVVAEARQHGLPVLCSENVGATDLGFKNMEICRLVDPISEWVSKLVTLLDAAKDTGEILWTWDDLANLHLDQVYSRSR